MTRKLCGQKAYLQFRCRQRLGNLQSPFSSTLCWDQTPHRKKCSMVLPSAPAGLFRCSYYSRGHGSALKAGTALLRLLVPGALYLEQHLPIPALDFFKDCYSTQPLIKLQHVLVSKCAVTGTPPVHGHVSIPIHSLVYQTLSTTQTVCA